jgi:hypothetical protein
MLRMLRRVDNQLIFERFSNILARLFSCAVVEK